MATAAELTQLLSATSIPPELIDELVGGASGMWLLSDRAEVLAGDLALCHPPLSRDEVRAVIRPTEQSHRWRLSAVAHDRPGLMASVAGSFASRGLSVAAAAGTMVTSEHLAVLSVTITDPKRRSWATADWDSVGEELRAVVLGEHKPAVHFERRGPVKVMATPDVLGRSIVTVEAPDRVGLLWAICSWFEDHGVNVEAAQVAQHRGRARDTFLVAGDVDPEGLVQHLAGSTDRRSTPGRSALGRSTRDRSTSGRSSLRDRLRALRPG